MNGLLKSDLQACIDTIKTALLLKAAPEKCRTAYMHHH